MGVFLTLGPYMPWALYFAPPLHVCAPPLRIPALPRRVPALRWRPVRALGELFKSTWKPFQSKGIVKKNKIPIICIF